MGTDEEFDRRVKDRLTEIAAVADTIAILNSDTAFDNFDKTVNTAFLQEAAVSSSTESEEQHEKLGQVSTNLRAAAARFGSPQIALLAARAQLDTFTKVKELIDKMVVELNKQQQDEIDHRDWCIDEMNSNQRTTSETDDKKTSLVNKIADLEKTIEKLTKDIEATQAAVAEMQKQMKRAGETREKENYDFQQTVSDQRMTQTILKKALARMQEVYAMLQKPAEVGAAHVHLSGNHTDPGNGPARFTKYDGPNPAGGRVVRMLEEVIADSKKLEDDAHASEEDAQSAYEYFMQETNAAVVLANKKIVNLKGAKATAEEELTLSKSDLKSTLDKLEELHQTLADLHGSCDFILKNFDARQEARAQEVQALK